MRSRPQALLLDLGNVCLPFDHGRMVRQVADLFAVSYERVEQTLLGGTMLEDFERGAISDNELHHSLCRMLGRDVPPDDLFHAASDIFTADPAMIDLLAELAGTEQPLVLVSNTSAPHIRFVRDAFPVLEHFDELVLSYEVGAAKPDQAFFDAAFSAAGCLADRCFYTDDIAAYVDAARRLGVDAEVFTGAERLREQLVDRQVL